MGYLFFMAANDVLMKPTKTPDISYLLSILPLIYVFAPISETIATMTQSTSNRDPTADPLTGSASGLSELTICEKTCLAATLTTLDRPQSFFRLDAVLKSDLTGSEFLTLKALNALEKKELVAISRDGGKVVKLLTENNDLVLRKLLADISNDATHLSYSNAMKAWVLDALVAECVRAMCYLVKKNGAKISSKGCPPTVIEDLVLARPLNEIKMLCWRAITQMGTSDLRLISVDPNDNGLETLFDIVFGFHECYLNDERKVPPFRNQPTYRLSSLSQIIARYFLNLSPRQLESNCAGLLLDSI